jgi:PAS domain S-box-containing protein
MAKAVDRTTPILTSSQWRQIVDAATHTAIISIDPVGKILSWNSGAEAIFGWIEKEMLGQSLGRVFPKDMPVQLEQEIADAREHGHGGGVEGWRCRKDGKAFWAVGELTPFHNEKGELTGFTKIVRDRTDARETEERLREERQILELLNRAGVALSMENDLQKLVQIVTDSGVELTRAEFGAFFYNLVNNAGESYMLYTLSGAPLEAFSKFPMPRNNGGFRANI